MSNNCNPRVAEINLVAGPTGATGANNTDPNLINAWGIVVHDGYIWLILMQTVC